MAVSPRTIERHLRHVRPPLRRTTVSTLGDVVRNHATGVLAWDLFATVTVFVVLHVGTRPIVHWNVTDHPTAEWRIQQNRMTITGARASASGARP
jgi:putative transposase